jgi:hypothetical protein
MQKMQPLAGIEWENRQNSDKKRKIAPGFFAFFVVLIPLLW